MVVFTDTTSNRRDTLFSTSFGLNCRIEIEHASEITQQASLSCNDRFVFATEFFSWREFKNQREVGALAGLAPTPYQSGNDLHHEQGISRAGHPRIRSMAIEIAWGWLRWQPQSHLSQWFGERFGSAGGRSRRVGIVAVARKLLIALWRYLQSGALPEGAELKAA